MKNKINDTDTFKGGVIFKRKMSLNETGVSISEKNKSKSKSFDNEKNYYLFKTNQSITKQKYISEKSNNMPLITEKKKLKENDFSKSDYFSEYETNNNFLVKVNDMAGQRRELFRPKFSGFGRGNESIAKNYYKRAIDFKKRGELLKAVNFYAKAVEENRTILMEPDMGLDEMLLAQAEKQIQDFPENELYLAKIIYYYDIFGEMDNAFKVSRKLLAITEDENFRNFALKCIDQTVSDDIVSSDFWSLEKSKLEIDELKPLNMKDKIIDNENSILKQTNKNVVIKKTNKNSILVTNEANKKEQFGSSEVVETLNILKKQLAELQEQNRDFKKVLSNIKNNYIKNGKSKDDRECENIISMDMSDIKKKVFEKEVQNLKQIDIRKKLEVLNQKNLKHENSDIDKSFFEITSSDGRKVVKQGADILVNSNLSKAKGKTFESSINENILLQRLKNNKGFVSLNEKKLIEDKNILKNIINNKEELAKTHFKSEKNKQRWLDIKENQTSKKADYPIKEEGFGKVNFHPGTIFEKGKNIFSVPPLIAGKTKKIETKSEKIIGIKKNSNNKFRYLNIVDLNDKNSSFVKGFSAFSKEKNKMTGAIELNFQPGPLKTFKIITNCDVLSPDISYFLTNENKEIKVIGKDGFDYRIKLLSGNTNTAKVAIEVSSNKYVLNKEELQRVRL
jgi:tetratricopeptide (TPR) repeat protein